MLGLFSFSGRTTRLGYLGVGFLQLAMLVGMVILAVATGIGGGKPSGSGILGAVGILILGSALTLWVGMACTARRLRDMGWPVFYGFAALILVNLVAGFLTSPLTSGLSQAAPQPAQYALRLLGSCAASFLLLLWPSARRANFDDIEAIFGGEPDYPALAPPEPAFARPAFTPQAAPTFARPDPSQPRAQFGLRGVNG